jgi:signal transduction histidine kinase
MRDAAPRVAEAHRHGLSEAYVQESVMANESVPGGERSKQARPRARAERGRDPLLSAICHDLRAPLAAVTMGATFVLQTTQRDEAHARSVKILEAMLRSCTQMERLIRNFADLSEIEGDAVVLRLGMHDAREILELSAEAVKDAAAARTVTIELQKPDEELTISADRDRLLRAIGHVVENAVKHAPEGSAVTLSVKKSDGMVAFSVVDRGPGLDPEALRTIGEREWRGGKSGFGLPIAHGFLAAHDGRLDVVSRPGEETRFTLLVPSSGPRDHDCE